MSTPSSSILDKIAKILAKAEATDNEHEADAFLKQAQYLATRYSIDLAVARQHTAKAQARETPTMRTIHIGARGAVGNAKMVNLFLAIARNNDVTCNIARNSTYVIAFGFPSDIEVTEALYTHLVIQMVEAGNAYLRSGAHRDDYVWNPRREEFTAPNGRTARLAFYDAFATRIGQRLYAARIEAEQAAAADEAADGTEGAAGTDDGAATGTALVLADKRAEVADFYKATSDARGSWRGNRRASAKPRSAVRAGREAGSKARIAAQPALPDGRYGTLGR